MVDVKRPKNTMVTRGVSLRPVQDAALYVLAMDAKHLSRSRILQRLIENEMTERYGENWPEIIADRAPESVSV